MKGGRLVSRTIFCRRSLSGGQLRPRSESWNTLLQCRGATSHRLRAQPRNRADRARHLAGGGTHKLDTARAMVDFRETVFADDTPVSPGAKLKLRHRSAFRSTCRPRSTPGVLTGVHLYIAHFDKGGCAHGAGPLLRQVIV